MWYNNENVITTAKMEVVEFFEKWLKDCMKKVSNERGQNLIEFALVIPIFLWLLMGMIDFGWYIKLSHDLTRANSQGARVAAYGAENSEIRQAVIDSASSYITITSENIYIIRQDLNKIRGTTVEVISNSVYQSITRFSPVHIILNNKPIQISTTSRIE